MAMLQNFKIVFTALAMLLGVLAGTATAQDGEPGIESVENDQKADALTPKDKFDHSKVFIPPIGAEVPEARGDWKSISDELVSKGLALSIVAPDGEEYTVPADASLVEVFRKEHQKPSEPPVADQFLEARGYDYRERGHQGRPYNVIGADTRVHIPNTKDHPHRMMGRLSNGCSGALIGKREVLTAAHCIYNKDTNKWYGDIGFSPGYDYNNPPFGSYSVKFLAAPRQYTKDHNINFDYAVLILNRDLPQGFGYMGFEVHPNEYTVVNLQGYPGEKLKTMWRSSCSIAKIERDRFYYPCDMTKGMSGSPVYAYYPTLAPHLQYIIYGVNSYNPDERVGLNYGTRLTDYKKKEITKINSCSHHAQLKEFQACLAR